MGPKRHRVGNSPGNGLPLAPQSPTCCIDCPAPPKPWSVLSNAKFCQTCQATWWNTTADVHAAHGHRPSLGPRVFTYSPKVRPIDDYKASLVNSSVTQVEVVTLHDIDHVACLGSALMAAAQQQHGATQLVAKCWDLAAAYKQIPLSDHAYDADSYIVVYNLDTRSPEIYKQAVLPFGSIASFTAFLRCALGI